jgi:putative transposase
VREKIETWRRDYNEFRPHSALDNMTPEEYVKKHLKTPEISSLRGTAFG